MLRLAIVFGYVSHSSGVARQRRWRVLAQHRRALDRAPQEEYAYVGGIQCVRSPVMYDLLDACGWLRRPWRSTRLKSGRAPEAISPAQEAWQRDCLTRLREVGLVSTDTPIRLWRHQSRFLRDLRSHCWAFSSLFVFPPHMRWRAQLMQRTHHVARALARMGHRVLYCTPSAKESFRGYAEIEPRLYLTADARIVEELTGSVILAPSTAWRFGSAEIRRWRNHGNTVVYDYIDHIDERITGVNTDATRRLFEYVSSATIDVAVASASQLRDALASKVAPKPVSYVPNGVDVEFYERSMQIDLAPPPELREHIRSGRPMIGYFGAIASWLCGDLVREAAALRPDWIFLFIGPRYQDGENPLPVARNVINIPPVDYRILPQYGRWFDIGMIPFASGPITRTTSPLKLFEYLALRKPVVAHAEMLECHGIADVFLFDTPGALVHACETALSITRDNAASEARREAAATADWQLRAASFLSAITAPQQ